MRTEYGDQRRGVLSGCQETRKRDAECGTLYEMGDIHVYTVPSGKHAVKGHSLQGSWNGVECMVRACVHVCACVFTVTSNRYAPSGPRKRTFRKFKEECVIVPQRHHTIDFRYSLLIFALCSGNMFYIVVIICNLFVTQTLGIDQYYIYKHFNG